MRASKRLSSDVVANRVCNKRFHARDALEPIAHEELLSRITDGLVTLLDVRPADEFDKGHIAGAVSIPLDELSRRLAELPKDREVIAYCRGPYCVYAAEAVANLRAAGFHARRLEDGFPEWSAAGFPVKRGRSSSANRSA